MDCQYQYEHTEGPDYSDYLPGYAQGICEESIRCSFSKEDCPCAYGEPVLECCKAEKTIFICPECAEAAVKKETGADAYLVKMPDDRYVCPECGYAAEGESELLGAYASVICDFVSDLNTRGRVIRKTFREYFDQGARLMKMKFANADLQALCGRAAAKGV